MNQLPRSIEIHLPSGDPRGIRVATLTASPLIAVEVPRPLLSQFLQRDEAAYVALYFLFSDEAQGEDKRTVYVGESDGVGQRLSTHDGDPKMDFWSRAIVIVSASKDLTKTHCRYLEWEAIKLANAAKRYLVRNGNAGSKPHTPSGMEATCLHYLPDIRVLLAILGQPALEPFGLPKDQLTAEDVFYCKSSTYDARAEYTKQDGLVVKKGSKARKDMVKSLASMSAGKKRLALIEDGRLKLEGEHYVFQEDIPFGSPSGASDVVTGTSSNGWIVWKTKDGKTLDELKRAKATAT